MGLFITLEGPDGSGKTTQMDLLEAALRKEGLDLIRTREPGGTLISEKIRDMVLDPACSEMCDRAEALLYAAARAQHLHEKILPALNAGKIVLCDRFVDSSLVYQGIGRNLGVETIAELNRFATGGVLPDLTIVIQIDYEEGLRRKALQRNGELDRLEQQKDDFHRKVHEGFAELKKYSPARVVQIDGSGSCEEVHAQVMETVRPYLQAIRNKEACQNSKACQN